MRKNLGLKLLGVWLILSCLAPFVVITLHGFSVLLAILGIAAGLLLLAGR
jgi:hypothetical protein